MHLEINTGGLNGGIAIREYQLNMSDFLADTESVISSFQAVSNATCSLNGGVGSLQSAVDCVSERIRSEEEKRKSAELILQKTNDFLNLTVRVDNQVASMVTKNKDEFYRVNPWLKPATDVDSETTWYEQAWSLLCGAGTVATDKLKENWEWVKDTAQKAWEGLVGFYQEHKKIIDTIFIAVGAVIAIVAVIVSGGAALVPLLGALGLSLETATLISAAVAVVAVVSTAGAAIMNVSDIWLEIDSPVFNLLQKALNVVSFVSNITYAVGSLYNAVLKITPEQYIASHSSFSDVSQATPKQAEALAQYTTQDYRNINNSLRGIEQATPENAKTIKEMKSFMDHASLPEDMTLYRGADINELGELKNLAPEEMIGKSYTQPGFMSTTTSNSIGSSWTGDLNITIHAPQGSQGVDITSISYHPAETEVLFNVGQQMVIESAEKVGEVLHITVSIIN